jgi:transcription elongation factor GreA
MPDVTPMTEEGMAKLKAEIAALEDRRPGIKKAIAEAREKGDLSENADYHAAREELGMLDARINLLASMVASAVVVDPSKAPADKAALGHTVIFKRLSDGQILTRTLVGAGQADPASGKILTTSPIGKALIGHGVGEKVAAELPSGPQKFEIQKISF